MSKRRQATDIEKRAYFKGKWPWAPAPERDCLCRADLPVTVPRSCGPLDTTHWTNAQIHEHLRRPEVAYANEAFRTELRRILTSLSFDPKEVQSKGLQREIQRTLDKAARVAFLAYESEEHAQELLRQAASCMSEAERLYSTGTAESEITSS